jgi:hypothetical protein
MTLYRVVDRDNQGWYPCGGPDGGTVYRADYGSQRDLADRSYDELAATREPLRPVEPVTSADVGLLRDLFAQAGRKTITTLAAALDAVFHRLREERGGLDNAHDSYEFAHRTLIAGRGGSWESQLLIEVVMFGNGLNLASAKQAGCHDWDVTARRAAGPGKRVHAAIRVLMAEMFWRWVTDPHRFTEVAETLAAVVSSYCDEQETGWKAVADQWLQPGGLAQADFSMCYRLFYSLSEHFDSGVI